jgi:MOSC domain-containing protein YiiM
MHKRMKIIGLYKGKLRPFGSNGKNSGINKLSVDSARVTKLGLEGDHQADHRFHGGEEKALHQYALSSYEVLMKYRPLDHKKFVPGSIGENICATKMADNNVCVGDIYQMGSAKVQISSPRMPCWKIDHKFSQPQLQRYIAKRGITGWYYRVLEEGEVNFGQSFKLLERPNPALSVKGLVNIIENPDAFNDEIEAASQAAGLDPEWQTKLAIRLNR